VADEDFKIIFSGLDKAGKTTIYKRTMAEMSIEEIGDSKPTRGIERHEHDWLDTDFSVWDLGGQVNYREAYLSKPEIFQQTKAMIFVVDIQDIERLDQAYAYYTDILHILVNVDPKPKLYVLFHKFDPEEIGKLRNNFYKATRLFRNADKIIGQKFKGLATSIYSNTIDLAIKRILFENFDKFKEEPTGSATAAVPSKLKIASDQAAPVPQAKSAPTPTLDASAISVTTEIPEVPEAPAAESIPVVKETPAEVSEAPPAEAVPEEKIEEEVVEEPDLEAILEEATPTFLDDVTDEIVDRLTSVINKRMKDTPEIIGISILSSDGKQVLGVAKTDLDYKKLDTLKNVVGSLSPKSFFKELSDIEYRGLGHLPFNDFDIYFARATDDFAVAVLATDVSTFMLQNAQRIVKSIRQAIGSVSDDEGDEPKKKKKDLVMDLRSKLKSVSGLDDI
jgi:hypothetical protein